MTLESAWSFAKELYIQTESRLAWNNPSRFTFGNLAFIKCINWYYDFSLLNFSLASSCIICFLFIVFSLRFFNWTAFVLFRCKDFKLSEDLGFKRFVCRLAYNLFKECFRQRLFHGVTVKRNGHKLLNRFLLKQIAIGDGEGNDFSSS